MGGEVDNCLDVSLQGYMSVSGLYHQVVGSNDLVQLGLLATLTTEVGSVSLGPLHLSPPSPSF